MVVSQKTYLEQDVLVPSWIEANVAARVLNIRAPEWCSLLFNVFALN